MKKEGQMLMLRLSEVWTIKAGMSQPFGAGPWTGGKD